MRFILSSNFIWIPIHKWTQPIYKSKGTQQIHISFHLFTNEHNQYLQMNTTNLQNQMKTINSHIFIYKSKWTQPIYKSKWTQPIYISSLTQPIYLHLLQLNQFTFSLTQCSSSHIDMFSTIHIFYDTRMSMSERCHSIFQHIPLVVKLQEKQKTFFSIILLNTSTYLQFIEGTYLQFMEETNHHIYNSLKPLLVHARN